VPGAVVPEKEEAGTFQVPTYRKYSTKPAEPAIHIRVTECWQCKRFVPMSVWRSQ